MTTKQLLLQLVRQTNRRLGPSRVDLGVLLAASRSEVLVARAAAARVVVRVVVAGPGGRRGRDLDVVAADRLFACVAYVAGACFLLNVSV